MNTELRQTWYELDREKLEVDFRDEVKHIKKNEQLVAHTCSGHGATVTRDNSFKIFFLKHGQTHRCNQKPYPRQTKSTIYTRGVHTESLPVLWCSLKINKYYYSITPYQYSTTKLQAMLQKMRSHCKMNLRHSTGWLDSKIRLEEMEF